MLGTTLVIEARKEMIAKTKWGAWRPVMKLDNQMVNWGTAPQMLAVVDVNEVIWDYTKGAGPFARDVADMISRDLVLTRMKTGAVILGEYRPDLEEIHVMNGHDAIAYLTAVTDGR